MSSSYHNYFFTQFAINVLPNYAASLYKCRRIGEVGVQQLLLDTNAFKTALLDLPHVCAAAAAEAAEAAGSSSSQSKSSSSRKPANASSAFTRLVRAEIGKAEAMLKTIGAPVEALVSTYRAVAVSSSSSSSSSSLPAQGGSAADLALLLDLKGVSAQEKQELLDEFARMAAEEAATAEAKATASAAASSSSSKQQQRSGSNSVASSPALKAATAPSTEVASGDSLKRALLLGL